MLRHRLLSIRAYDRDGTMIAADVAQGTAMEEVLERMLSQEAVDYVHVHNAMPGCFSCAVERA